MTTGCDIYNNQWSPSRSGKDSYFSDSRTIKPLEKISRLGINDQINWTNKLNPNRLGISIAAYPIEDNSINGMAKRVKEYIKVQVNGQTVAIRINEFLQKINAFNKEFISDFPDSYLSFSKSTIKQIVAEGKLEERLQQVVDVRKYYKQILSHYKNIKDDRNKQLELKTGEKVELTAKELQQLIEEVIKNNDIERVRNDEWGKDSNSPESYVAVQFNGRDFIVGKEIDHLTLIHRGEQLGKGKFANVYTVRDLSTGQVGALKEWKTGVKNPGPKERMQGEYKMLGLVNDQLAGKRCCGIQKAPFKSMRISSLNREQPIRYAFMGEKYEGSYEQILRARYEKFQKSQESDVKLEQKLGEIYSLLRALYELAETNILHGDIKEANILFRRDQEGNLFFYLSDFGSAKEEELPDECSPLCVTKKDHQAGIQLLKKKHAKIDVTDEETRLGKQKDVYAMGLVVFRTLADGRITHRCSETLYSNYNEDSFLKAKELLENIIKDHPSLIGLVTSMMHDERDQRPTGQQALYRFVNYLKESSQSACIKAFKFIQTNFDDVLSILEPSPTKQEEELLIGES